MAVTRASGERLIGLIRVSTDKQAGSGLGLEAQTNAIETYRNSVNGIILRTYKEVESGTHNDVESRPQLQAAIADACLSNATLVIAKIDRLVRSTSIMHHIRESGVNFIACDNPHANKLMINVLVAIAEDEAERISVRTKDALAAYKREGLVSRRLRELYRSQGMEVPADVVEARGGKLGAELPECRNLTPEASKKGAARSAQARRAKAIGRYRHLARLMLELRGKGNSLRQIADQLNAVGYATANDKPWNPTQVKRVIDRAREGMKPS